MEDGCPTAEGSQPSAKARIAAILCLGLLAGGCQTSLKVQRLGGTTSPGVVYFLPKIGYRVEHVRELESCGPTSLRYVEWLSGEIGRLSELIDLSSQQLTDLAGGRDKCDSDQGCQDVVDSAKSAFAKKSGRELNLAWLTWIAGEFGALNKDATNNQVFIPGDAVAAVLKDLREMEADLASKGSGAGKAEELGDLPGDLQDRLEREIGSLGREHAAMAASLGTIGALDGLRVKHSSAVKSQVTADPEHAYVLDYEKLSHRVKNTTLGMELYPNGTLKSINAAIDDQSGEIIASVVRSAATIASIAGGFPLDLSALRTPGGATAQGDLKRTIRKRKRFDEFLVEKKVPCKLATLAALASREKLLPLQKKVTSAKEEVAKAEKCLKDAGAALIAAEAEETAVLELLKKPALVEKPTVEALVQRLVGSRTTISAEQEKKSKCGADKKKAGETLDKLLTDNEAEIEMLAQLNSKLQASSLTIFVPEIGKRQVELNGADPAFQQWIRWAVKRMPDELRAFVAIHQKQGLVPSPGAAESGVVFRQPADAEILVCKKRPCLIDSTNDRLRASIEKTDLILSEATRVPQLGVLGSLPLTNKTFQNNTLTAAFGPTGELTSFSYKDDARAKRAAAAIESSVETLQAYAAAKREAKEAALTQEVAELEAEKQKLIKLKEIAEARKALEAAQSQTVTDPEGN